MIEFLSSPEDRYGSIEMVIIPGDQTPVSNDCLVKRAMTFQLH
ncbi:hypothetical protein N9R09_00130 [Porticoccaceae bacterium]|nr:hypothetical protein [Porticoccaceae bacterium]